MAAPNLTPNTAVNRIVVNGKTITPKSVDVDNDQVVELQFHVNDFQGKQYCYLRIYAVEYGDTDVTQTATMKSTGPGGAQPLGTIKIGS